MHLQTCIALAAVAAALLYFVRSTAAGLRGGKCASGCGSCGAKACPAKRLEKSAHRA